MQKYGSYLTQQLDPEQKVATGVDGGRLLLQEHLSADAQDVLVPWRTWMSGNGPPIHGHKKAAALSGSGSADS
jgi:hypothetical protein